MRSFPLHVNSVTCISHQSRNCPGKVVRVFFSSLLKQPGFGNGVRLSPIKIFDALGATYDQPEEQEQYNHPANDKIQQHHTRHPVKQSHPESPDLKTVVSFEPVRCIFPVHVRQDETDDRGEADDDAGQIQQIHNFCRTCGCGLIVVGCLVHVSIQSGFFLLNI